MEHEGPKDVRARQPLARLLLLLAAVAVAAVGLAGCGGDDSSADGGHTLTMAMPSVPPTLDNEFVIHPMVIAFQPNVYETPLKYASKPSANGPYEEADIFTPTFAGGLAESWTVDKPKRVWTFKLRANARSPFGNTLSADDVIWSFERKLSLKANSALNMERAGIKSITQIKKVDADTVRITTAGFKPLFPHVMTLFFGSSIWDSTEVKKHTTTDDPWAKDWLSKNAAGYGAYQVTEYTPGSQMVLEANPNYYGDKPFFSKVIWREVPDAANRLSLLEGGSVDYAFDLTPQQRSTIRDDTALQVLDNPSNAFIELGFNTQMTPYNDPNFRRALAYAFPYEDVLKTVYFGEGAPRRSIVPSIYPGYTDKYWAGKTDIARAKELIAKVKLPEGFTLPIAVDSSSAVAEQIALLARTSFAGIGVSAEVDKQPPATFSKRLADRQQPAYIFGDQAIYPDVGFSTWLWFHDANFPAWSEYKNPRMERLFIEGDSKSDPAARQKVYDEVQQILMRDMPVIPIAEPGWHITMKKDIGGYVWFPDNATRLQFLSRG